MPTYNSRGVEAGGTNMGYHSYPSLGMEDIYSGKYHNIVGTADNAPPIMLGTEFRTWDGRVFRYIKSSGAIAFGAPVEVDALVNLGTFAGLTVTEDNTRLGGLTGLTAGANVGKLLYINTGTAANACRTIVANGTTWIKVDRAYSTAPGATSNFDLVPVYHGNQADGATECIIGYATVGLITSGYYGWIQTRGVAEHILAGTGAVLVSSTCKAVADGVTTGVTAADNDGSFLGVYSLAAASAGETFPGVIYMAGLL